MHAKNLLTFGRMLGMWRWNLVLLWPHPYSYIHFRQNWWDFGLILAWRDLPYLLFNVLSGMLWTWLRPLLIKLALSFIMESGLSFTIRLPMKLALSPSDNVAWIRLCHSFCLQDLPHLCMMLPMDLALSSIGVTCFILGLKRSTDLTLSHSMGLIYLNLFFKRD